MVVLVLVLLLVVVTVIVVVVVVVMPVVPVVVVCSCGLWLYCVDSARPSLQNGQAWQHFLCLGSAFAFSALVTILIAATASDQCCCLFLVGSCSNDHDGVLFEGLLCCRHRCPSHLC